MLEAVANTLYYLVLGGYIGVILTLVYKTVFPKR